MYSNNLRQKPTFQSENRFRHLQRLLRISNCLWPTPMEVLAEYEHLIHFLSRKVLQAEQEGNHDYTYDLVLSLLSESYDLSELTVQKDGRV